MEISIHTPTKGVTGGPFNSFQKEGGFQSTLPRRE